MSKTVWCERTLITNPYYFGVALSEQAFQRSLRNLKLPRDLWPAWIKTARADATLHYFENGDGRLCAIMCIRGHENRTGIEVAGLIVHEAVHLWQAIRESIGETNPSSEFEAYSVQAIAQGLMDAFVKAKGKP